MDYKSTKSKSQSSSFKKRQVRQVINCSEVTLRKRNYKKTRFIRKLSNKIIFKASKNLNWHQLQNLLNINCKNMQVKMQSYVNACTSSTSKTRVNDNELSNKIKKQNETFMQQLNNTSLNNTFHSHFDDDNSDIFTESEGEGVDDSDHDSEEKYRLLEPKNIRSKESLRKIYKIRKLPDYKKIEKLLNSDTASSRRKKQRSLNSVTASSASASKSQTPFWNTYSYLLKQIEHCITNKDWTKLTTLLIHLSGAVKKCEPILLKATILNFISNPTSQRTELLEGFLKECYSCRTDEDMDHLLTQLFHLTPKINTLI